MKRALELFGVYVGRGWTLWRMPRLSYEDAIRMTEIADAKYEPAEEDGATMVGLFTHVIKNRVLARSAAILLKPFPGLGWWNTWRMRRLGIERAEVARLFDIDQLVVVVNRFFVNSAPWMTGFLSFAGRSTTILPEIPIIPGFVSLRNPLFPSPTETSKPLPGF